MRRGLPAEASPRHKHGEGEPHIGLSSSGANGAGYDQTLAAFLEEWLQSIEYSVRPATWRRYAQYMRLHVAPLIGEMPLGSVRPQDLQLAYAERTRAGLSTTSVLHMHRALYRALSQAHKWGLVDQNVAAQVNPPRAEHVEIEPLSPTEAERFLEAVRGDRFEALYTLAITTGMRQGELLALRWPQVDLERRSIRVVATIQFISGRGLVLAQPKTIRSRRHVQLTELAVSALMRHRRAQEVLRLKRADLWKDLGFVFTSRDGGPLYATNLKGPFKRILGEAGLRRVRFHDLRHTTATLLLGQGVHPKIVSEMLGHSSIGITLDLYSHATPTMQEKAASALDELLGSAND